MEWADLAARGSEAECEATGDSDDGSGEDDDRPRCAARAATLPGFG